MRFKEAVTGGANSQKVARIAEMRAAPLLVVNLGGLLGAAVKDVAPARAGLANGMLGQKPTSHNRVELQRRPPLLAHGIEALALLGGAPPL